MLAAMRDVIEENKSIHEAAGVSLSIIWMRQECLWTQAPSELLHGKAPKKFYKRWTPENMLAAMRAVIEENKCIREAAGVS